MVTSGSDNHDKNSAPLSPEDYQLLHEDCLLRYQKLRQDFREHFPPGAERPAPVDPEIGSQWVTRAWLLRAGWLGALQVACQEAEKRIEDQVLDPSRRIQARREAGTLQALMQQTQLELDEWTYDWESALPEDPPATSSRDSLTESAWGGREGGINATVESILLEPMMRLLQPLVKSTTTHTNTPQVNSGEEPHSMSKATQPWGSNADLWKPPPQGAAAAARDSLEAFFEAYPECMREDLRTQPFSSSSSRKSERFDDDDDDDENPSSGPPQKPKRLQEPQQGQKKDDMADDDDVVVVETHPPMRSVRQESHHAQATGDASTHFPGRRNPYAQQPSHPPPSSHASHRPDPSSHHRVDAPTAAPRSASTTVVPNARSRSRPALADRVAAQNDSSWEDYHRNHALQYNPFTTAREYAAAGGGQQGADEYSEGGGGGYPPPRERNDTMAGNSSPPPPDPPRIRESLKRKFQPPQRTCSEAPPVRKGLGTGRLGGTTATSSGKVGNAGTQNIQRGARTAPEKASENDDDDLPEELRRFGKDLVEKIESEIMDSGEPVTFDDIAGLADAKQTVQEIVCWPMKRPDLFTGLRRAPNGLLLYGPPGTGKTFLGKAIAHESGATFFSISSSSLTSKWIGEGEKLVRTLFAVAAYREPSVVFIDEIDSLLTQRKSDENEASRRMKTEFLVQLDGTGTSGQGRVLIIGATNRPQELDEAARRRFTKRLYIPLPEVADRESLLRVLLGKNNHCITEEELGKLAVDTAGFSGADLKALSTDAAMGPIRELGARALEVNLTDVPPIAYKHFRKALRSMKPSVAPSDLVQYEIWDKTYGTKQVEEEDDDEED